MKSKEVVSNNNDHKTQDDLGQWRKAELKRRGEVMYQEVVRPSATLPKNLGSSRARWYMLPSFSPLVPSLGLINLFKTSSTSFRTNWDFRR